MAEVISQGGQADLGAIFPRLTGEYIPAIDEWGYGGGLGLVVPWGAGRTIRESMLSSAESLLAGEGTPQNQQMTALMNSILPTGGDNYNYYFEGLVGPQGVPGPPGPQGVGITNYVGGAGTPSAGLTTDIPITNGIVFSKSGSNVVWTTGTLRYKGINYTIVAEATGDTNKYIYWDKDSTPTSFLTTDTLATVLGADKWAMCYNDGGDPYPAAGNKILHGGVIEASTIDTVHLNALSITTEKINNLDVTMGKIANNAVSGVTYGSNSNSVTITSTSPVSATAIFSLAATIVKEDSEVLVNFVITLQTTTDTDQVVSLIIIDPDGGAVGPWFKDFLNKDNEYTTVSLLGRWLSTGTGSKTFTAYAYTTGASKVNKKVATGTITELKK